MEASFEYKTNFFFGLNIKSLRSQHDHSISEMNNLKLNTTTIGLTETWLLESWWLS